MATLSHLPPSLEVTAAADDMEISSELGRFDNDIDIDLDLTGDHLGDADGDYMLEDAKSDTGRAPSIHDQEMNQESVMYGEQTMEDDTVFLDEHLTDADIEDPADTSIKDFNEEPVEFLHFDDLEGPAMDGEVHTAESQAVTQESEDTSTEQSRQQETPSLDAQATVVDGVHVRDFSGTEVADNNGGYAEEPEETHHDSHDPNILGLLGGESTARSDQSSQPDGLDVKGEVQSSLTEDTTQSHPNGDSQAVESHTETSQQLQEDLNHGESDEAEAQLAQNEDSPYHPVVVVYGEAHISLFPPREQDESQTYFLRDASLAARSISDLLHACREVLGNTISEEQELQIEVHELDLTIGEESAHALSTSFSELLEVYLSLHSLDGTDQPEPLYVTLTTKPRFSARLSFLRGAVADGRGFSQLWDGEADEGDYPEQADFAGENEKDGDLHQVTDNHVEPSEAPTKESNAADSEGDTAVLAAGSASRNRDTVASSVENTYDGEQVEFPEEESKGSKEQQAELGPQSNETQDAEVGPLVHNEGHVSTDGHTIESTVPSISHLPAGRDGNQEEEALIDFSDHELEDGNNSSGSSTVVGDGSAGQEDGKARGGSAAERNVASPHIAENSLTNQDGVDHDGADRDKEPEFEYEDGAQEQYLAEQDNFSAEFDEDAYGLNAGLEEGEVEGEDDSHMHETGYVATEDQIDYETDPQSTTRVPAPLEQEANDQEEAWNDFLESGQALEPQEEDYTNQEAGEPPFDVQPDFAASTETLVAAPESHDKQQQQADIIAADDFDEITYDEEEDDDGSGQEVSANEPHAASGRPSESPPGKRSFTEHLEGDLEQESELEAKRLRST